MRYNRCQLWLKICLTGVGRGSMLARNRAVPSVSGEGWTTSDEGEMTHDPT
jgi:hypothetical protein